ncbi:MULTISPECIES: 2-hydroxychromene-2-carboxylate isomerase [unclassified Ketobacter]|uniref:2-hydroxychromene-2-carboxylate isomerase n=1 Tax=unclassified Ketobacter TaxID=2639109 RepID=UPI000F2A4619|nr:MULTISPECIES: 2-hydroxychromene-2-carboxylate isomerase [unclassified Ketobacter]RLT91656.1 MAG: 2-hydroxychromene-2-carboxylate isomerase [Ketobacter sp. GenoA1]RLT98535.1 MAG: 2-hydroxychromene-2-carboxylate isomerase [Ketobacter sp.]
MKLEFWFEFGSTYSYPSAMRIEELATQSGVSLVWKPFLLGPIFKSQGWSDSPFNLYPAKGNYMWRDLERICRNRELEFRKPTVFPRNGLLAARVACRFSEQDWIAEFVRNVFRANFQLDKDISNRNVVKSCLPLSVEESESILSESKTERSKALLRNNSNMAVELGIFGAPSFIVGNELFWGDDRLEQAIEWSKQ